MTEQSAMNWLYEVGAVIVNDHFVYTSGKHGPAYVNKDAVYTRPDVISFLCKAIAEDFAEDNPEVVAGPAIGGVIMSQWTAYHLSVPPGICFPGHAVRSVYAEKEGDDFVIKRGYDKEVVDKRILVVEDVLTTGCSAKKVVEAVRLVGGQVVGLGVLCNRGDSTAKTIGVSRLFALTSIPLDAYNEAECPLCAQGVPINTEVGKGREFLARKQEQAR